MARTLVDRSASQGKKGVRKDGAVLEGPMEDIFLKGKTLNRVKEWGMLLETWEHNQTEMQGGISTDFK